MSSNKCPSCELRSCTTSALLIIHLAYPALSYMDVLFYQIADHVRIIAIMLCASL